MPQAQVQWVLTLVAGGGKNSVAGQDESLLLDGGDGGDWVLVFGGERAAAIGGAGRDWIFNTSVNGIVYGDTYDGLSSSGTAENWEATTTGPDGRSCRGTGGNLMAA